jgi:hypothetical protein
MKKNILIYGLIAGAISTGMFLISIPLQQAGYFDPGAGMIVGYTSMVAAFSMIFFAIKNYRDNHNNGSITFGKGFRIGILITVIASLVYAATWEVYFAFKGEAYTEHYINYMMDELKASGVTGAALDAERAKLEKDFEAYQHFSVRFGFTIMEIFPVGLLITLFTAAILKRRATVSPA